MDSIAPVPDTTLALNDRDHFLSNALSQTVFATAHGPPLRGSAQNPLNSCSPTLSLAERDWNWQGHTTTGGTFLLANAKERSDRVDSECKVENRVQGKVRWWWRAREKRTSWVDGWHR